VKAAEEALRDQHRRRTTAQQKRPPNLDHLWRTTDKHCRSAQFGRRLAIP
jgi:hypothetical protein